MANSTDDYLGPALKTDPMLKWLGGIAEANREGVVKHPPKDYFAVFDCVEEPKVGVSALVDKHTGITRWELGMAVVLVDRLMRKFKKGFNPLTAHRLLVTAMIIAIKMQREVRVMEYFVRRTGLPYHDACMMERVFLVLLDWEVFVSREEVEAAIKAIDRNPLPHFEDGFASVLPLSSSQLVTAWLKQNPTAIPVGRPRSRSSFRGKLGPASRPPSRGRSSRRSSMASTWSSVSNNRPLSGIPVKKAASPQHKPSVVVRVRDMVAESRKASMNTLFTASSSSGSLGFSVLSSSEGEVEGEA